MTKTLLQNINESFTALEKAIKDSNKVKTSYIDSVQNIIVSFVKGYNNELTFNSDILARLIKLIETFNKSDLSKLGAFLVQNTTIKSVSIKDPTKFVTTDYIVKNGKKYKTVAFLESVDIDNLPCWYDCKHESKKAQIPLAKKVLSNVKALLNTIDSVEDDTKLLALVADSYKQLDNLSKKLEQYLNS